MDIDAGFIPNGGQLGKGRSLPSLMVCDIHRIADDISDFQVVSPEALRKRLGGREVRYLVWMAFA